MANLQPKLAVDKMRLASGKDINEKRTETTTRWMIREKQRSNLKSGGLSLSEQTKLAEIIRHPLTLSSPRTLIRQEIDQS
jgi:hypothetical protein